MSKMHFIERSQIDDEKWNHAVLASPLFRHYALTYYLDAACDYWMGLVNEDYSWVWPIPIKRFPVKRVYQPLMIQQLGPYGENINQDVIDAGVDFLKSHFTHIRIKFNDHFALDRAKGKVEKHQNFELDLAFPYSLKRYNRTVQSNLKKAEKASLQVRASKEFDPWCINTFKTSKGKHIKVLDSKYYAQVEAIYGAFAKRNSAVCYTAELKEVKIAQALILNSNQRLLFLFSAASDEGKQCGAMHAIVDEMIKSYSEHAQILDFEGSNDDGLAYFYSGFGAEQKVYLQLTESRLKWPLNRLLK